MKAHSIFPFKLAPSMHTPIFPVWGKITTIPSFVDPHVQEFFLLLFLLVPHPNPQQALSTVHSRTLQVCPFSLHWPPSPSFSWTTAKALSWCLGFHLCPPCNPSPPPLSSGNQSGLSKHKLGHVTSGLKTFHTTLLITFTAMTIACNDLIICFLFCFLSPLIRI